MAMRLCPATVTDLRQGIVLGKDGDGGAVARAAGYDRAKGRFHPANAPLHVQVMLFQEPGQGRRGVELLVVQFRVVVDVYRQVEQLLPWLPRLQSWSWHASVSLGGALLICHSNVTSR